MHHDLIFREPVPSSVVEMEFGADKGDGDEMKVVTEDDLSSWPMVSRR
jgi:hypothetical protein